ncbi:ATP-binding protein [Gordonia rhizosphera NBRC 16068]|uniref:Uncharacterized protein n=2 Tax=Gordonia rhizosphera TaxID=83341 RepID=K6X1R6_9ACTN|nr:hypothetical protein GORHZ_191_00030 [Gordonia rhizosphera NBRC 16068]
MTSAPRYGMGDAVPKTVRQHDLEAYKKKFVTATRSGRELLLYLERSTCGVWRCEQDQVDRRRWWLNITLPKNVAEMFDAHLEILLVYVEYDSVEPRLLERVQERLSKTARIDNGIFLIASFDASLNRLLRRRRGEFAAIDLDLNELNPEYPDIRHKMSEVLTTVDHYDMTTPIHDPGGFFGRSDEFQEIISDIERGQSVGVFGLRKTGKTSLLNYVARRRRDARKPVIWLDISGLSSADDFRLRVLQSTWERVSELIDGDDLPKLSTLDRTGDLKVGIDRLRLQWLRDVQVLSLAVGERLELFIDEVDQLLPGRSILASESSDLLVAFTQLRGMIQDPHPSRGALLVCAGVDPAIFERPILGSGADNLVYKLVRLMYLSPLSRDDMAEMVRDLGRRMGVRVRSHEVIDFLYSEYGGHALLTRKACSLACRSRSRDVIPWHMDVDSVRDAAREQGEGSPLQQAREILESFGEWFPEEASLLGDLWSTDPEDRELARLEIEENPSAVAHAVPYGLLKAGTSESRIRAVERAVSGADI